MGVQHVIARALVTGCIVFPAPLLLVPLAGGPAPPAVLGLLFPAELGSGVGGMATPTMCRPSSGSGLGIPGPQRPGTPAALAGDGRRNSRLEPMRQPPPVIAAGG